MTAFLIELSRWYNLLFAVPILIVILYQILHTFALLDIGGIDDGFGDLGAIAADTLSESKGKSIQRRFFNFLNPRQIPGLMVVVTFTLLWGGSGLACNRVLIPIVPHLTLLAVLISGLIALTLSTLLTHLLSRGIALAFPTAETDEIRRADLVGTIATVTSKTVTPTFGMARVDTYPFGVTVFCRVEDGEEPIQRGEQVVIWDYHPKTHLYKVQRLDKDPLENE
jgi:membrane protein implicated in regulation of membrane protease activity